MKEDRREEGHEESSTEERRDNFALHHIFLRKIQTLHTHTYTCANTHTRARTYTHGANIEIYLPEHEAYKPE